MVKIILIKSLDEWATTKQACTDELVFYLSFFSHNIYIYIYIFIYVYIYLRAFNGDPVNQTNGSTNDFFAN